MWQTLFAPIIVLCFFIVVAILSKRDLKEIQAQKSKEEGYENSSNNKNIYPLNNKDDLVQYVEVLDSDDVENIDTALNSKLSESIPTKISDAQIKDSDTLQMQTNISKSPSQTFLLHELSAETFRKGIILSEILSPPKAISRRRRI